MKVAVLSAMCKLITAMLNVLWRYITIWLLPQEQMLLLAKYWILILHACTADGAEWKVREQVPIRWPRSQEEHSVYCDRAGSSNINSSQLCFGRDSFLRWLCRNLSDKMLCLLQICQLLSMSSSSSLWP